MLLLNLQLLLAGGAAAFSWHDISDYFHHWRWPSFNGWHWPMFPDDLRGKPNLMELAADLNLTVCVDRLTEVGISRVINHEGYFTLFCPTNEAFMRPKFYPGDDTWTDRMRLHVAVGKHNSSDFHNEVVHRTLLDQRDIRINRYTSNQHPLVTANGRPVVEFDHLARNGYLHVISEVMTSVYSRNGSVIGEIERCCPQHSMLLELVDHADFFGKLDHANPVTLLAPLNEAFVKIHPRLMHSLKKNVPLLKKVLSGHVIPGTWYTAGLSTGDKLQSWAGNYISVSKDARGHVRFSGVDTGMTDVTAGNGAVHSVAALIIPPHAKREFRQLVRDIDQLDW